MDTQGRFVSTKIKVLFEDSHFVVFDKPPGLLVIPTPKNEKHTLTELVNRDFAPADGAYRLHPCHRLDRDTSGIIIFAKGKKNQQLMMELFHRKSIVKKYTAFVHGRLTAGQGELRSKIADFEQKKFHRHTAGKAAVTRYKVKSIKRHYTIIEVQPVTGRTNQIRIQFSEFGFPLVGERKYAFARDFALKFRRTALHAGEIGFPHPVSHKFIKIVSPLHEDMVNFMTEN